MTKNSALSILISILLLSALVPAFASAEDCSPIIEGDIKYSSQGGVVQAENYRANKVIWETVLFEATGNTKTLLDFSCIKSVNAQNVSVSDRFNQNYLVNKENGAVIDVPCQPGHALAMYFGVEFRVNLPRYQEMEFNPDSRSGMMLDFRPSADVDPIIEPIFGGPYQGNLGKCKDDKFVLYREFSDAEIAKLNAYLKSPAFIEMGKTESEYYLLAQIQRHVGERHEVVGRSLLIASWRARDDQYQKYAREALKEYLEVLKDPVNDQKKWITYQLTAGELERRLSLFQDAQKRFQAIQNSGLFNEGNVADTINVQLKLIALNDSRVSSTNAESRAENNVRFALPMPACRERENSSPGTAKIDNFCSCRADYPKDAFLNEEQGSVALRFDVGADGKLMKVDLERSSGFTDLDIATKEAVGKCQFRAARKNGRPVRSSFTQKFSWTIIDTGPYGDIQTNFEINN